jgi:GAF domain-containing protein
VLDRGCATIRPPSPPTGVSVTTVEQIGARSTTAKEPSTPPSATRATASDLIHSRPEVRAMLTVSRAMADGGPLADMLGVVCTAAAGVVDGADRASIVLIEGTQRRFRLAGGFGLSDEYRRLLSTGEAKLHPGEGPSGLAYESGAPVVIEDLDTDPRVAAWAWRRLATAEDYRAIVSLPLIADGVVLGTLNVYRTDPGPWSPDDVRVLAFFAEHAAGAVRTAQLLDERSKQLAALRRLVRALRGQTHEHANRLHAIAGLLALDEVDEAKTFIDLLESDHAAIRRTLDRCVQVPTVAGLVLAEAVVAAQRGIRLTVTEDSRLLALPPSVSDTQIVTILGNLLDNACDAVAALEPELRDVQLRLDDRDGATVIEVTNRGDRPGLDDDVFADGVSAKPGHAGIGLGLVADAVRAAMGTVELRSRPGWTSFRCSVPA